jgi:hypothetical protein
MPSPRLRLWQVLRDEYELFHAARPDVMHNWRFRLNQLKHPVQLALRLREPDDEVSRHLLRQLSQESRNELQNFDGRAHPTPALQSDIIASLNALLSDLTLYQLYDKENVNYILAEAETELNYAGLRTNLLIGEKLWQVNRWLLEETYTEEIESADDTIVKSYYRAIHPANHSALCLSGGGIRSATFNLGLLQGLARHGLLEQFEYLSTVSGGGFSGGWLTAWIDRHPQKLSGVVRDLGKQDPVRPIAQNPLEPEPEPLRWLRSYSNFLNPKLGLFSADTWTLVATILRNIFLNWLVFVPVVMAALMLPRLWVAFVSRRTWDMAEDLSIGIGFIMGMVALLYIGLNLPSTRRRNRGQTAFLLACLIPLIISAAALATYLMRASQTHVRHDLINFVWYQVAIIAVPWLACAFYQSRIRRRATGSAKLFLHFMFATLLILAAQIFTAWLLWMAATAWSGESLTLKNSLLYACFAVPVILLFLSFTGVLLAGLTSNYTEDDDQEWWARAGAWVFIVVIGWSVVSALVIFGPQLLIDLPERLAEGNLFSKEVLIALGGIISGVISLYGGFSSKAPANDQQAEKSGAGGKLLQILMNVAAALFLVFLIIVFALLTNLMLVTLFYGLLALGAWIPSVTNWLTAGVSALPGPDNHLGILYESPLRLLLLLTAILLLLGYLFGRLINTNKFSLHYLWRNRIIRAYLGASNPNRQPNSFTGFDGDDNVRMHELKPVEGQEKKMLHFLNFALNLVGGEKLAWQERRAESFTVSPLHCGNYRLGYRRADSYGGRAKPGDADEKRGISLGTSIAISGAFVSPNMGYMQSSPVIRFLMTLFNVRFGWWLGNPGRAGDGTSDLIRTYDLNSPRLSVKPIVKEALGMTNDKSDYIYLSDGGHFENFGLYEMVLRRCRLIVIGDASSDAEYTFESLGQSLRKIRIDFGIPVEFKNFSIVKPSQGGEGAYAAVGTINYQCIDGGDPNQTNGTVILIKPTLLGDEARDILNYASENTSFPQEFIGDQWFSESQFESYRALGSHIVDALCRESGGAISDQNTLTSLDEFRRRVEANLNQLSAPESGQRPLDQLRENIT